MNIQFEKDENGVYRIPGTDMQVEIILASRPANGAPPIITLRTRHPRIIHSEVNTHRVLSRNARSSRAVPFSRMVEEIKTNPFVPWHWGKNQKGMQAGEETSASVLVPDYSADPFIDHHGNVATYTASREEAWLAARDHAVAAAKAFAEAGYHKQIVNRLLEPFMWIDTLITSTSWANFLWLRNHEAAEPHFHDLAALIEAAISGANYQELEPGEWHLPYITQEDTQFAVEHLRAGSRRLVLRHEIDDLLKKISASRCARISYAPFDGDGTYEQELKRYEALVGESRLHASPVEHQATPDTKASYRKQVQRSRTNPAAWETVTEGEEFDHPELGGNLGSGWVQFRKTIAGEFIGEAE